MPFYELKKCIGKGNYGNIYLIKNKNTNEKYALKEIKVHKNMNEDLELIHQNILSYKMLFISNRLNDDSRPDTGFSDFEDERETLLKNFYCFQIDFIGNDRFFYLIMELCLFSLRDAIDLRNEIYFETDTLSLPMIFSKNKIFEDSDEDFKENKISELNFKLELKKIDTNYKNLKENKKNNKYYKITDPKGFVKKIPLSFLIRFIHENSFKKYIFKEILKGLNYLHQNNISHNDLKPTNIFFIQRGEYVPKIGDFGLSSRSKKSKDIQQLGIIYFQLLYPVKTMMELDILITDLKNNRKLPIDFVNMYPDESKIIIDCLNQTISLRKLLNLLSN